MKKNNINKMMRFTAALATTVMAVSATGITASAIDFTGNIESISPSIELRNVEGIAGGTAVVQVIPTSGNTCNCYDFVLEYDPRLELEVEDITGANTFTIFEEDDRKFVSLVGFTMDYYEDGVPMAALNFHLPADAAEFDDFGVSMAEVKTFASPESDLEIETPEYAEVTTVSCDTANGLKTYQQRARGGAIIGSSVGLRGDANRDGKTNVRDASAVAAYLATHGESGNIDEIGQFLADVDDDNKLSIRDASKIARYIANGSKNW